MSCLYPIDGWRSRKVNESGKRSIVFRRDLGFEDMHVQVPCGKCLGCLQDRAKDWSVRIYNESTLHDRNSFLTLTYSDQHLPPDGKLQVDHMQKFVRSLRDAGNKFRYFACGEYGGLTKRAHYHAIIFGMDFKCPDEEPCGPDGMFINPSLTNVWKRGNVVVAPVTPASCAYVAGYCNKKLGDPDTFNIMSRRPGIGHAWIDRHHDDVRRAGAVIADDGGISKVPARYMEWQEEELASVKRSRQEHVKKMSPDKKFDKFRERKAKEVHLEQRARERALKEKIGK